MIFINDVDYGRKIERVEERMNEMEKMFVELLDSYVKVKKEVSSLEERVQMLTDNQRVMIKVLNNMHEAINVLAGTDTDGDEIASAEPTGPTGVDYDGDIRIPTGTGPAGPKGPDFKPVAHHGLNGPTNVNIKLVSGADFDGDIGIRLMDEDCEKAIQKAYEAIYEDYLKLIKGR